MIGEEWHPGGGLGKVMRGEATAADGSVIEARPQDYRVGRHHQDPIGSYPPIKSHIQDQPSKPTRKSAALEMRIAFLIRTF